MPPPPAGAGDKQNVAVRTTFHVLSGLGRERGGKVVPKPHRSEARLPQLSPQRACCTCSEAAPTEVTEETFTTQFLGCLSPWRGGKTKLCSWDQG